MTSTFTFSQNISKKVTAVAWLASRIKQVPFYENRFCRHAHCTLSYVSMLGVTSLMQALEIRAQNFNNLPVSNVIDRARAAGALPVRATGTIVRSPRGPRVYYGIL